MQGVTGGPDPALKNHMALSNHERVGKALDILNAGLRPFVERELQAAYGKEWVARAGLLDLRGPAGLKAGATRGKGPSAATNASL